jgi:hypothetical protein
MAKKSREGAGVYDTENCNNTLWNRRRPQDAILDEE